MAPARIYSGKIGPRQSYRPAWNIAFYNVRFTDPSSVIDICSRVKFAFSRRENVRSFSLREVMNRQLEFQWRQSWIDREKRY